MNIAIATNDSDIKSIIPEKFAESNYLLIVDEENGKIIDSFKKQDPTNSYFATKVVSYDCEAIICGSIEKECFETIASVGITRYFGAGLLAEKALQLMLEDDLPFTTDFVGGTGCDDHAEPERECTCNDDTAEQ